MYENVKVEMLRKGMNLVDLSDLTGIRYQTLSGKLRGESPILLKEAFAIKTALGTDMPLEELFVFKDLT